MADEVETRTCDTCHKQVAVGNFALHESHCRRFLCLCPVCDEPVPRDLLTQHRLDEHAQVKCSKCNKKVERCRLTEHESEACEQRLQRCPYCQLELPWRDAGEHGAACGSRTERCGDCGRYVTLRDQLDHARTCPPDAQTCPPDARTCPPDTQTCPPDTQTTLVPATSRGARDRRQKSVICIECMKSFPAEDIEGHQLECSSSTSTGDLEAAERELEEEEEEDQREEEEDEREEEEDGVDLYREEASATLIGPLKAASLSAGPSREAGGGGEPDPDQISTCPHCQLVLPLTTLRWHEAKCQIHIRLK